MKVYFEDDNLDMEEIEKLKKLSIEELDELIKNA